MSRVWTAPPSPAALVHTHRKRARGGHLAELMPLEPYTASSNRDAALEQEFYVQLKRASSGFKKQHGKGGGAQRLQLLCVAYRLHRHLTHARDCCRCGHHFLQCCNCGAV